MNDEIIVFELPDGSIRYTTCPVKQKRPGEINSQWLNRVYRKTIGDNPEYSGAVRINKAVMPDGAPFRPGAKKMYRGAWRHAGGGEIVIDMPAARDLRMAEIRAMRDERLKAADGPTAREVEQTGPKKQGWIDYKQALRDLPAGLNLNAIATPEELKAFEPAWPPAPGA